MNKQEIYEGVKSHLLTQKEKSQAEKVEGDPPMCLYRSGSLKCAIGALIKDEFYSSYFEGEPVKHPAVISALEESLGVKISDKNKIFLTDLQEVHDSKLVEEWEYELEKVARYWNLQP